MTYQKNRQYYGKYPRLPENVEDWRLKSCFNFEKEIETDITKFSSNLHKQKKKLNNLRIACLVYLQEQLQHFLLVELL